MSGDEEIDPETATKEQNEAASKIQAVHRGRKGRKKAKKKKKEKEDEEERKRDNPKLGDHKHKKGKGGALVDKGAELGEHSLEFMLKMFGNEGGAYLRKGSQRNCRDVPMILSFAMYWGCMLFLYFNAKEKGNIDALFYPVTFEGVSCGVKSDSRDLREFKSLYYPNPTLPDLNFCVRGCPGKGTPAYMDLTAPFSSWVCHHDVEIAGRYAPGSKSMAALPVGFTDQTCEPIPASFGKTGATCNWLHATCGGGKPDRCAKPSEAGSSAAKVKNLGCRPSAACAALMPPGGKMGAAQCYHPVGRTQNILYQCVPLELAENATQLLQQMSGDMGTQHFLDLQEFWWVCCTAFGIALVLSFVWILFLDYFAGPLIWFTVYASVLMCPIVGTILLYQAGDVPLPDGIEIPPEVQAGLAEAALPAELVRNVAYACYAMTFVLFFIFCIFKDRITMSIGVIEEASDCFLAVPKVILLPIFTFLLELPVLGYGVFSSLYILSMRIHSYDPKTDRYDYTDIQPMLAFNAFGILWSCYLLTSVQYMTIAGACADWYYTVEHDGERDVQLFSVERSLYRTIRYSFGSTLFGSLVIAVVLVAKWIATYIIKQVMAQSPENKIIQILGHCLICIVSCIEKFVRFLGKLAFIECAIYGCNFCSGISKAASRLLKNIIRFSFLSLFAHIMVFLGKVGVVVCTVLICQLVMTTEREAQGDAAAGQSETPYAPLIGCGLAAGITVLLFMSTYETAIDTIMMCFLEDEAENDGHGKLSFASGELAQFMKNTKSISDAAEQYENDSRQAKTNRIRADNDTHDKLKDAHGGVGGERGRSAKKRKAEKKGGDSTPSVGTKVSNPMEEEE